MSTMILCHKCAGVLAYENKEDIMGLLDCSCMSGYARGFEPSLTREQAIGAQLKAQKDRLTLYTQQGRGPDYIQNCERRIAELEKLKT